MSPEDADLLRKAAVAGLLKDLRGLRISMTGRLSMKRDDMAELIRSCGGSYDLTPTIGTEYLIVGDTGIHGRTRKISEARIRGTEIISESDFIRMIKP